MPPFGFSNQFIMTIDKKTLSGYFSQIVLSEEKSTRKVRKPHDLTHAKLSTITPTLSLAHYIDCHKKITN